MLKRTQELGEVLQVLERTDQRTTEFSWNLFDSFMSWQESYIFMYEVTAMVDMDSWTSLCQKLVLPLPEPFEVLHRDVTDGDLPTKSFLRICDSVLFFSLRQTRCFQLP